MSEECSHLRYYDGGSGDILPITLLAIKIWALVENLDLKHVKSRRCDVY